MVKALFDANILVDYLMTFRNRRSRRPYALQIVSYRNDACRSEARQYSILANGIQQDRCFLLSSYESVLLAHPIRALDVEDADVEKNRKTIARSE